MPSKHVERRRGKQKTQILPTFRIENEYHPETVPQYFQVAVNVLDARKLVWANQQTSSSYVVVRLGKKTRRTAVRRNMEDPYYKEYFVFEMHASIRDIQRLTLTLSVMELRCCAPSRLLGQANIELTTIWNQPYHQVFRKWAQLSLPKDALAGPVGFLKVDISIIFRGEVQYIPPVVKEDNIEENLLVPLGYEQNRANYMVTIYKGFGLPNNNHCHGDHRYGKLPSTYVKVSFCGLVAKTSVQQNTNNPNYNERLSFVEMFPNLSQIINIEVIAVEGCFSRILCGTQLELNKISHEGENGFLPTFGPSLIHMSGPSCGSVHPYVEEGPFYRGALLLSLNVAVPYHQQGIHTFSNEPISILPQESLWSIDDFCIYCPVFEVSMLDRQIVGRNCGVAITMGEIMNTKQTKDEFNMLMSEIKLRKLYYTGPLPVTKTTTAYGHLDFPNAFPVLQLAVKLPDFRFRMFKNNMIQGIVSDLDSVLQNIERRLKTFEYESTSELSDSLNKAADDAAANIVKYLEIQHSTLTSTSSNEKVRRQYGTELDEKLENFQKNEIQKIYQVIAKKAKYQPENLHFSVNNNKNTSITSKGKISRKIIKVQLSQCKEILEHLKSLIFKTSSGWPDIVIWLLNRGSRVAYTKVSAEDLIFSVIPEQCGKCCARIQTLYLKPVKCPKHLNTLSSGCYCLAAKLEVMLWMGLFRQQSEFISSVPEGYSLRTKHVEMCLKSKSTILQCRCFIYRAKLNTGLDNSGLADTFVRINLFSSVQDTQVKFQTLTPVYNQVLKIEKFVFMSWGRVITNPPMVVIEIYNREYSGRPELVGRLQMLPVVDDRTEYEFAPKLQWYELHRGMEYVGQLMMSAQIVLIPETLMKSTIYSQFDESVAKIQVEKTVQRSDIEVIPNNLIPKSTSYKIDIYWWGLRDIAETKKPCVVLEIDELSIKSDIILDKKSNCNFPNGRTTHAFEAPLKEVYCPPLSISLYDTTTFGRTVFLGTNVIKNPNKYIINWLHKNEREASLNTASFMSTKFNKANELMSVDAELEAEVEDTLQHNWKHDRFQITSLFRTKPVRDEEFTLLPVIKKNKYSNKHEKYGVKDKHDNREKDWWLRFFCSQKECTGEDKLSPADKITVYNSELECQPGFSRFKDWCVSLKLYNGKKTGIPEKDDRLCCGVLKAGFAIYRWPPPTNTVAVSPSGVELNRGFFNEHPNNDMSKYLVRVYIVKGFNLMAKDFTGKSDPYVIINCGKKKMGDRKNYIPKTLNPIFGKLYEFRATMPDDYLLSITVHDYDIIPPDDLIGCTSIDLEDRVYTRHRATCGLACLYSQSGSNKWRDCYRPSVILEDLCVKNHIPPPIFTTTDTVMVNGIHYTDGAKKGSVAERKENICLGILREWHTLPICGYHLVPEHVETRTLYNPDKPGLDQGKLQMWVDIFPLDTGFPIPPAVNITPRKIEEYELRVVVWDVEGVKLDDYDILTGQKSSDIYVKAWIGRLEEAQNTDVHYRSLTGVGNFNWRMVFKIFYQHAERKMVVKQTSFFSEAEDYLPPVLFIQVMDSDAISADDFLGSTTLDLNAMPRGAKTPRYAKSPTFNSIKKINLFTIQSLRGWWPLKILDTSTKKEEPAGVIDLELTLLPMERALAVPAGLGREAPQPLPPPRRPETSFNPFLNPFMMVKMAFRGRGWKVISGLICSALLIILLLSAYLELPKILMERWLGRH